MNLPRFLHADVLHACGIDHGFGTRNSGDAAPADVAFARQVHGARLLCVPPHPQGAEADALYSERTGAAVGVRTADCVPLLVAHPAGGLVAAIHAGWRGSAARITEHVVRELARRHALEPDELVCAIGPHIGPCCYEVDEPVRAAIAEPSVFRPARRAGHWWLDLGELNRQQLLRAGLRPERVERVGGCTACDAERFSSHRRDHGGERMAHYVRVRA